MYLRKIYVLLYVVYISALLEGCRKNNDQPSSVPVGVASIRFRAFDVKEAAAVSIDITHPVISNGQETTPGNINIVIPKGNTQLQLTPLVTNINNDSFAVEPALGIPTNFKNGKIRYILRSKFTPASRVNYDVVITEQADPVEPDPKITSFAFLKSSNPFFLTDITAEKIIHELAPMSKIYIFVPVGTGYDNLVAKVESVGGPLVYSQDPNGIPQNSTDAYPLAGKAIDYSYPKVFYLTVKHTGAPKTYQVIVDVKNPIKFMNENVTTGYITTGHSGMLDVTEFINQGNNPITLAAVTHSDQVPAGLNVLRAMGFIPSMGLRPRELADAMANVGGPTFPAGVYKTTAIFQPKIVNEPGADELLLPSKVNITSAIRD